VKGVVSSIVNFGAFVDLGGVDGLIHVSELSWKHIDHPSEVVKVGDKVTVEVLDVDLDRERISLSLKATQEDPWQRFARTHVPGQIVKGKVTKIVQFGVFVPSKTASRAWCTSPSWPTATSRTPRPSSS
jgi:small subunit ribosomal protein S1